MLPWMNGLGAVPYYGAPGYVFGLDFYPDIGLDGCFGCGVPLTPIVNSVAFPGLLPAGLLPVGTAGLVTPTLLPSAAFLTPMITSNALLFNTLPIITGTTPFLANVTFSGLNAASIMTSSMISQTAAIQATLFPIMGVPLL
jgi:hypothetical protein